MLRHFAAALAAGSLGLGGSAVAGDAQCLWNHVPTALQQSAYAAYDAKGLDGLQDVEMTDPVVAAAAQACGGARAPGGLRAAGIALVGMTLQHAAERKLLQSGHVDSARLSHAWAALPPADHQRILDSFKDEAADPRLAFEAVLRAARLAGWPQSRDPSMTDPTFRAYADYFTGKAQVELVQTQF